MPIISRIGRKSLKVRLLIASIYVLLIAGSVTMIYPFLLMLAGTGRSNIDATDVELIPRFLYDDVVLYRKTIDGLHNENISRCRFITGQNIRSFREFPLPDKKMMPLTADWEEFLKGQTLEHYHYQQGFLSIVMSRNSEPYHFRTFKKKLFDEAGGDIQKVNQKLLQN